MRVLRNAVLLAVLLAGQSIANLTNTLWYPPTNAVVRWTDGTNWVFAKDVWRTQLGEAALERLAVAGQYNARLEFPPVRGPWENEFCHTAKTTLQAVATTFLDLRMTNSAGVFTNFYDITGAAYSNRYWTISNLLVYCDLPTNFFDYTPARFLGPNGLTNGNTNIVSGYSTAHYGWEGVYRIVKALDYYHPRPAWREVGVIDGVETGEFENISSGDLCAASDYPVTSPWTTWTPTNYTTNINIAATLTPFLGSSGSVTIVQQADGTAYEDPGTNAVKWWAVDYAYSTPEEISPGAWMRYYTNAWHPTNILDAQSFQRPDGYHYSTTLSNYYVAAKASNAGNTNGTDDGGWNYYVEISPDVATNGMFYLAERGAWPVIQWTTNFVAVSTTKILQAMASTDLTVAEITQNPPSTNFTQTGFAAADFGDIDGIGYGHNGGTFYSPHILPYTTWLGYDADACSPGAWLANGWAMTYLQYGLQNNVAIRPAWRWK